MDCVPVASSRGPSNASDFYFLMKNVYKFVLCLWMVVRETIGEESLENMVGVHSKNINK